MTSWLTAYSTKGEGIIHTYYDTRTRDNTLALYGAKHHSPAYYALRTIARAAVIFAPVLGIHALAYTLLP